MPRSNQQFQKALCLLDRGDIVKAEGILREVVASAEASEDRALLASVRCCLGNLLVELGRPEEAVLFLKPVAALDQYDDLVAHERREAIELLQRLDA